MRTAEPAPAFCSGCFQARPDMLHVDFEVAWDGPVIQDGVATGDGATQTVSTSIDDLMLCEKCVRAAAAHVGMVDPGVQAAELEQLREINERLVEKNRGLEDYASRMEAAVAAKPATPTAPRRQKAEVK